MARRRLHAMESGLLLLLTWAALAYCLCYRVCNLQLQSGFDIPKFNTSSFGVLVCIPLIQPMYTSAAELQVGSVQCNS